MGNVQWLLWLGIKSKQGLIEELGFILIYWILETWGFYAFCAFKHKSPGLCFFLNPGSE